MSAQNDLLILSNRGPISFGRDRAGSLQARRGAGGLVVTLGPGVERDGALWLACAATEADREAARLGIDAVEGFRYHPVLVDQEDYQGYYDVVANQSLWFCLHGLWDLPRRPRFDRHWWAAWDRFRRVNEQMADAAATACRPGGTVLVQDYQLALVAGLLADRRPDIRTASFIHTPWCSPQEFSVLPSEAGAAILGGLAGGGACGFHSPRWARAFEDCCREQLGDAPRTFVSPAAADVHDLRAVAASEACERALSRLDTEVGDRRLIVRVDRMELSKN
ncbi:MAG TPA: trehalose-6-phosphate synthase, partial [Acidimicrobiales bacterium]|nr:trehalose-6-phosphate synthase [Acidimicrobiales bacterium]